jgi:hypothetical protein
MNSLAQAQRQYDRVMPEDMPGHRDHEDAQAELIANIEEMLEGAYDPLNPSNFGEAMSEAFGDPALQAAMINLRAGRNAEAGEALFQISKKYWTEYATQVAEKTD